jgi:hypothetical protein
MRVALQNQRDDLLAFAGVLDGKLTAVARGQELPDSLVREACVLHRLPTTSASHWQGWSQLRTKLGTRFHILSDAVALVMAQTPRSNHRRLMRSQRAEQTGHSPRELLTGESHSHWLTLLGLGALQPQQA